MYFKRVLETHFHVSFHFQSKMPACKNDAKRYFKGDEPSPKGRGYCAHADAVGKRRIGGDRKMWVVKSYKQKNGKQVHRWVHVAKKVAKK